MLLLSCMPLRPGESTKGTCAGGGRLHDDARGCSQVGLPGCHQALNLVSQRCLRIAARCDRTAESLQWDSENLLKHNVHKQTTAGTLLSRA